MSKFSNAEDIRTLSTSEKNNLLRIGGLVNTIYYVLVDVKPLLSFLEYFLKYPKIRGNCDVQSLMVGKWK